MKIRLFAALGQHPIARDPRIELNWEREGKGWQALLTGSDRVWLHWQPQKVIPSHQQMRAEPRAPTACCTHLLFMLLGRAKKQNPVEFYSFSALCNAAFSSKRKHVPVYVKFAKDALRLWQQLSIEFPRPIGRLPPPIEKVELFKTITTRGSGRKSPHYRITISQAWLDACESGREAISFQLPLPLFALPQNIVLYTLLHGSCENVHMNKFVWKMSGIKRALLCTPHTPYTSWSVAKRWYAKNNGRVEQRRLPYTLIPATRKGLKPKLQPSSTFHIEVRHPTWKKERWRPKSQRKPWHAVA